MRRRAALIALMAIMILAIPTNPLIAFTDTIMVRDDVIFIDSNEPNAPLLGDLNVPCPQTAPETGPALLYIDANPLDERLHIACFQGRNIQKQEVASAKYLQVTQLDRAIFLVGTSGGSTDRGLFVMDLQRGIGKQLARSTRIQCLRSVPERGKAMLIHSDLYIGEVRYLELDLATLRLTLSYIFRETDSGYRFIGVCPGTMLSPDFKHVAYMAWDDGWWFLSEHRLTVMNLSTMEERCLDDQVEMAIPVTSSVDNQTPPLEWINASQIVYRHMPDAKRRRPGTFDVLCVFKCVDVSVGSIVEVLQETLHLGVGSGSLKVNPLNGELVYSSSTWIVDDLWVLDPNQGTLTPAIHPFSVVNEHYPDRAKVYFGERLLQAVDGMIAPTLISPLHGNLAYVLHPADPDPNTILSVKIVGEPDPIEVEECPNAIVPVGWIEQR